MSSSRKRFAMLFLPVGLILLATFLAAQGPPNQCLNACRQTFTSAVKACHGDRACLAAAHAVAQACVQSCGPSR